MPRTRDVSGAVAFAVVGLHRATVQFSPPPPAGGAPRRGGAKGERTFFGSLTGETNLSLTSFLRVVRFAVLRGAGFLTGFGTGFTRTNWMGLPFARMRSSTSEFRQGRQEFVQALGAEVAHVKVRVALDELITDAGGAHPARAVVHFINKAVDDAANGVAVDGRVVPGVGAGGGLGGGAAGAVSSVSPWSRIRSRYLNWSHALDEGGRALSLAHTDDEFPASRRRAASRVKSLSDETMQKPSDCRRRAGPWRQ